VVYAVTITRGTLAGFPGSKTLPAGRAAVLACRIGELVTPQVHSSQLGPPVSPNTLGRDAAQVAG
jgi:hypothetical protein